MPRYSNPADSPHYAWVVLAISYVLMLFFALPLQALPPLMEQIRSDVSFSQSLAGFLMGTYGLPGLFMPVAAAMLAMKYDRKMLVIISLWIMALGLVLFAAADNFWLLAAGRLISGVGAKVILSLAPLFVITFFENRSLGATIGVFNTAVPIGSILSLNFFGYAGHLVGWRPAILSLAVVAGLLVFLVSLLLLLPPPPPQEQRHEGGILSLEKELVLLGLVNLIVNAATLAFITFAPQYFVSTGASERESNFLASLIIVEMAALGPLAGYLADRGGMRGRMLASSAVVMAAAFLLLTMHGLPLIIPVGLLGAGAAVVPVVVFPLLKEIIPSERMSIGIAVLIIASNIGSTVGPVLMGWMLDSSGYAAGFMMLGALSLVLLPLAAKLPATARPSG